MLDNENKDALSVSGSAVIGFRDDLALTRMLVTRRWRKLIFAAACAYVGLGAFLLVRDAGKYVRSPQNLVPLVLGFLVWMLILLGCGLIIGSPVLIVNIVRLYVAHRRLKQKLGSRPCLDYIISNDGLFIRDYSGSHSFISRSKIFRMTIGRKYIVFLFKHGGLRLLPLRHFSELDIAAAKAIAQNLNMVEPVSKMNM